MQYMNYILPMSHKDTKDIFLFTTSHQKKIIDLFINCISYNTTIYVYYKMLRFCVDSIDL